jgi:hypothetical protein
MLESDAAIGIFARCNVQTSALSRGQLTTINSSVFASTPKIR